MRPAHLAAVAAITALLSGPVTADVFSFGVCRSEPTQADWRERCEVYLAGMVHAMQATGHFCPDGRTSVRKVIALWRAGLAQDADRRDLLQAESLIQTLRERPFLSGATSGAVTMH